jgi:hypothetical protein
LPDRQKGLWLILQRRKQHGILLFQRGQTASSGCLTEVHMAQKVSSAFLTARLSADRPAMVESVVRWWIDNFPEAPLQFAMPHLGAMADAAVVKANAYQITSQPDVCAFAMLMWLYGPTFDEHPAVHSILISGQPSDVRIERLFETVPEEVWDEINASRDEERWFPLPPDTEGA